MKNNISNDTKNMSKEDLMYRDAQLAAEFYKQH